jgi:hypothetical protein
MAFCSGLTSECLCVCSLLTLVCDRREGGPRTCAQSPQSCALHTHTLRDVMFHEDYKLHACLRRSVTEMRGSVCGS